MPSQAITILVTGFEPFGGSTLNPSQVICQSVADRLADMNGDPRRKINLRTAMLPVDTKRIAGAVEALWLEHEPDVVLHFGESAKADRLTLERVAVNLLDFDLPDNAGQRVVDEPIDPSGPAARFATLNVRALHDRLEQGGIASRLSLSAGAYLCNQTLYLSLGQAQQFGGKCVVGFVHVPSLAEQVQAGERSGPAMARGALLDAAAGLIRLVAELHGSD